MITRAFVLADPAVPGAALVTDETALSDRLAAAGQQLIDRGYLRYKPGTSLVAALRLASGPAFAYAVSAAARPKLRKTCQHAPPGSVLVIDEQTDLLIARPAADRDLPALADLDAALAPAGCAADQVIGWSTLAYKPQRRWVGRLAVAGAGHRIARAYRPADLPSTLDAWGLAALVSGHVRVPAVRASVRRLGLVVTDWLDGTPLDRLASSGPVDPAVLHDVGLGLALLHTAATRPATLSRRDDRLGRADAVADQLAGVLPDQASRARAMVDALAATAPVLDRVHPVHGDFSADQVIVDGSGRIGITDWDRAGWGEPAADLGALRAAGLPAPAFAEVLAGYRAVRELSGPIGWYTAWARLLRLAEPLRRCRPDWREAVAATLAGLEEQLRS